MVSTATAMPPGSLGDPADWLPRDAFMEGRQGVLGPDTRSATPCTRQHILRIDGGQDGGPAPLPDTVTKARHPAWAQRLLTRLRDGGPTPWGGRYP